MLFVGISVVVIIIVIIICAAVLLYKMMGDYDLGALISREVEFKQMKKVICDKAEIGDRLTDEEMQILYKMLR